MPPWGIHKYVYITKEEDINEKKKKNLNLNIIFPAILRDVYTIDLTT